CSASRRRRRSARRLTQPPRRPTMTIEYADLSCEGLSYRPHAVDAPPSRRHDHVIAYLDSDRDIPEIAGTIPNLHAFAVGEDHNLGAFQIKAQDSRIVTLRANLAFLMPTTALIVDCGRSPGAVALREGRGGRCRRRVGDASQVNRKE